MSPGRGFSWIRTTAKAFKLQRFGSILWVIDSPLGIGLTPSLRVFCQIQRTDIACLRRGAAECEQVRQCAEYIGRNRDWMQYADFRAQGLTVGSGVVEAGCKTTIGARLKRAGMHGSVDGANTIIALRCCYLSGRFEDFWERRSVNR